MASTADLRSANLDSLLKSELIQLCRDHGISTYGLKSQLIARLLTHRETLPSLPATPAASTAGTVLPTPSSAPLVTNYVPPPSRPSAAAAPRAAAASLLPSVALPGPSGGNPPPLPPPEVHLLAQQAAQQAAAQVLAHFSGVPSAASAPPPPTPATLPSAAGVLPPLLGSTAVTNSAAPSSSTTTSLSWVYQPPSLHPHQLPGLTAAAPAAPLPQVSAALPPAFPPLPQLAPFSGSIPSIPARFATAATAGEFIDFTELLHALDLEGTEETPLRIELGDDNRLTLPRKPKKRQVSSFPEWARCFGVYAHYLTSHQPLRSTDLFAYMYIIATCHAEYTFSACMAYDVAFRRKAARFRLTSWGQIDPQLYTKAFTGSGKARPRAWCDHCLTSSHSPSECPLFSSSGPAKKPRVTTAGPRHTTPTRTKEVCRNFNRGGAHVTTVHDATCASPLVALGHTQPHPVPPSAPPQGSPEPWDLPQPPLSPSFLTSDTHLPSPPLSPLPVIPQPPTTGSPQPISPSLTSHTAFHQLPHPRQHLPPPLQLPAPLTHTPVNTHLLSSLLSGHPRRDFTSYLLQGLNIGFRVGYDGPHRARPASNLRSSLARPKVIDSYLEAECQAGHTVGPFPSPPLPNFVINPLGAVPKKRSGKWRLIMHLSYPPGSSVNDGIDIRHFRLRYSTVSDAIDSVMRLGRGALMAKIDIKSAFRLCPVHPADHHLLGMKWKGQFYFDRVLPFGLRSAPYIFNCLADAIEWVAAQQGVAPIHHYLDDLFIAGTPDSDQCAHHLQTLTSLCSALGVPLAEDKREGPTTCLEYLGILLDSSSLEARLPPDKLQNLHNSLQTWSTRSSCPKRELLSLIGTLSFAAKVVPAGRTFLRRMIDLSTSAAGLDQVIPLSQSFSLDLQWWREFATAWNGRSFFLLPHWTPAPHLPSLLRSFFSSLNLSYPDHLTLWAALLLAFFSFLRSGELLSLQRGDLHRTTDGLYVHIRQSKTDPFRSGAVARVFPTGDPSLCAVTTMDSYLTSRGLAAGPLFQLQTAALTRQRLNSLIRDLASRSGADPSRYSSHSFRIGAASAAAAAGIPDWRIQALGRWSSDCYKRYIRLPSSETTGVTAALARAPI